MALMRSMSMDAVLCSAACAIFSWARAAPMPGPEASEATGFLGAGLRGAHANCQTSVSGRNDPARHSGCPRLRAALSQHPAGDPLHPAAVAAGAGRLVRAGRRAAPEQFLLQAAEHAREPVHLGRAQTHAEVAVERAGRFHHLHAGRGVQLRRRSPSAATCCASSSAIRIAADESHRLPVAQVARDGRAGVRPPRAGFVVLRRDAARCPERRLRAGQPRPRACRSSAAATMRIADARALVAAHPAAQRGRLVQPRLPAREPRIVSTRPRRPSGARWSSTPSSTAPGTAWAWR